jgi:epoxyqueuosine reductase QueG
MNRQNIEKLIVNTIARETADAHIQTRYRKPQISLAEIENEKFKQLKSVIGDYHLMPDDLLPDAQSIVVFFLPFSKQIITANARSPYVAREWAIAYIETNNLIRHICDTLVRALKEMGTEAAWQPPTGSVEGNLGARWSHKSAAVLAGLGSFGLNRLVITDSGCAGRFGSLILDAKLTPNIREYKERCLHFHDKSCQKCIEQCPANAFKNDGGFDGTICRQYLDKADAYLTDLPRSHVCGKCSVGLPCSMSSAVK